MKEVRVGIPYKLSAVSEDRWGRVYKHPYELVGYSGMIDGELAIKIGKFTGFKPSETAEEEISRVRKSWDGTPTEDAEILKRIVPTYYAEVVEALQSSNALLWEFNIRTGSNSYKRAVAVFQEPRSVVRINLAVEYVRLLILKSQAWLLNRLGSWRKLPYPTYNELEEQSYGNRS